MPLGEGHLDKFGFCSGEAEAFGEAVPVLLVLLISRNDLQYSHASVIA